MYDYDSIMTATDSTVINRSSYYKEGVSLPDGDVAMAERPYSVADDNAVGLCMLALFFLLSLVLSRSGSVLLIRLQSFFKSKRTYTDERYTDNTRERLSTLALIFICCMSLSAVWFNPVAEQGEGFPCATVWLYAIGCGAMMALLLAKICAYGVVNWIFFNNEANKKWTSSYLYLTSLTALIFYPAALVCTYAPQTRQVVTGVVILMLAVYEAMLFYKLIINFRMKKYSYVLIILYFCSVEMVPALAIWRLASYFSGFIIENKLLY